MSDMPVKGVVGGMGGSLDGPQLGGGGGGDGNTAGFQVGAYEDKIGYQFITPKGEQVILLFTIGEMYSIMAAQTQAIQYAQQFAMNNPQRG